MQLNVLDLLRADGSIVINKKLAKEIGLNPTIVYSELVSMFKYFESRGETDNGWFYCTIEKLEDNTTLKRDVQDKAIKKLADLNLIEVARRGLPAKRYFRITDKILEILLANKSAGKPQTDNNNDSGLRNTKKTRPSQIAGKPQTRVSENRSNNTNNNTNNKDDDELINNARARDLIPLFESNNFHPDDTKEIIDSILESEMELDFDAIKETIKKTKTSVRSISTVHNYFMKVLAGEYRKNFMTRLNNQEIQRVHNESINFVPYNWLEK
jgi:DNA-binding PadR family transcriptional regulator